MASQLTQLKSRIESIAVDAKRTGASLGGFQQTFRSQVSSVEQAIGGSTQRKDREVVDSLLNASRRVNDAVIALEQAARVSSAYGASL